MIEEQINLKLSSNRFRHLLHMWEMHQNLLICSAEQSKNIWTNTQQHKLKRIVLDLKILIRDN